MSFTYLFFPPLGLVKLGLMNLFVSKTPLQMAEMNIHWSLRRGVTLVLQWKVVVAIGHKFSGQTTLEFIVSNKINFQKIIQNFDLAVNFSKFNFISCAGQNFFSIKIL